MPNAGAFKKGEKRPGQGRPKGLRNKNTTALKDMILGALQDSGGIGYLKKQAKENPNAFLSLVGKVLPLQVAGDKENPLRVKVTLSFD
jgi:hypothetical protein